jgi:hypothetical protein
LGEPTRLFHEREVSVGLATANEALLMKFYAQHAPNKASLVKIRELLQTYTAAQIRYGLEKKYGASIALHEPGLKVGVVEQEEAKQEEGEPRIESAADLVHVGFDLDMGSFVEEEAAVTVQSVVRGGAARQALEEQQQAKAQQQVKEQEELASESSEQRVATEGGGKIKSPGNGIVAALRGSGIVSTKESDFHKIKTTLSSATLHDVLVENGNGISDDGVSLKCSN